MGSTELRAAAKQAQPEALRLADVLDERVVPRWIHATGQTPQQSGYARDILCAEAAAELRRLHAQRDALLEALKTVEWHGQGSCWVVDADKIAAAIAKCEENT